MELEHIIRLGVMGSILISVILKMRSVVFGPSKRKPSVYVQPGSTTIEALLQEWAISQGPNELEQVPGFQVHLAIERSSPKVVLDDPDRPGQTFLGDDYHLVFTDRQGYLAGIHLEPVDAGLLSDHLVWATGFQQKYRLTVDNERIAYFHPEARRILSHHYPISIQDGCLRVSLTHMMLDQPNPGELKRMLAKMMERLFALCRRFNRKEHPLPRLLVMAALDPDPELRGEAAHQIQKQWGAPHHITLDDLATRRETWQKETGLATSPLVPHGDVTTTLYSVFWQPLLATMKPLIQSYAPFAGKPPTGTTAEARRARLAEGNPEFGDLHAEGLLALSVMFPEYAYPSPLEVFNQPLHQVASPLVNLLLRRLDDDRFPAYLAVMVSQKMLREAVFEHVAVHIPNSVPLLEEIARNSRDPRLQLDLLRFFDKQQHPNMLRLLRELLPGLVSTEMDLSQAEHLMIELLSLLATWGDLEDLDLVELCRPHCFTPKAEEQLANTVNAVGERAGMPVAGQLSPVALDDHHGALSPAEANHGALERLEERDTGDH